MLASAGYRVIVPYLRGYGIDALSFQRNGSQRPAVGGRSGHHRPDGRAEDPEGDARWFRLGRANRRHRRGAVAGALQGAGFSQRLSDRQPGSGKAPLPPAAELQWWYQYYFATERGRDGYEEYRHDFAKLIWQLASPKWDFDDATFDRARRRSTIRIMSLS